MNIAACRTANALRPRQRGVDIDFAEAIDCFILYLATERGLSENYQLSTKRFLEKFSDWAERLKRLSSPREVELAN
jgi:site-specific recombinase XerD